MFILAGHNRADTQQSQSLRTKVKQERVSRAFN